MSTIRSERLSNQKQFQIQNLKKNQKTPKKTTVPLLPQALSNALFKAAKHRENRLHLSSH